MPGTMFVHSDAAETGGADELVRLSRSVWDVLHKSDNTVYAFVVGIAPIGLLMEGSVLPGRVFCSVASKDLIWGDTFKTVEAEIRGQTVKANRAVLTILQT